MGDVYAEEAHRIVDEVINKACERLSNEHIQTENTDTKTSFEDDIALKEQEKVEVIWEYVNGKALPNIKWMSIEDFSVEDGLGKIEQFLQVST